MSSASGSRIVGRFLGGIQGLLHLVVTVYFLTGWAVSNYATREVIRSDSGVQQKPEEQEATGALERFYQVAFEPVNRPFRLFLPKQGRYLVYRSDVREWYLDVAPLVACFVVNLLIVVGFTVTRKVLRAENESAPQPHPWAK